MKSIQEIKEELKRDAGGGTSGALRSLSGRRTERGSEPSAAGEETSGASGAGKTAYRSYESV